MIRSQAIYAQQPAALVCDGLCTKAWGINARPCRQLSEDPDDYEFLADSELGEAPADPGTYEGGHAKPGRPVHNRWCWRECERSTMSKPGSPEENLAPRSFDVPLPNKRNRRF